MNGSAKLSDVWKIEDMANFVVGMDTYISERCQYGDEMDVLNDEQRVFFITQSLEMEVNNGGFSQYFYNSAGNFSCELVDAFEKIGAHKTAEICRKAISVFGSKIPSDRSEREDFLDEILTEEIEDVLSECDDAFYEYEEDLTELNYRYIINNKSSFM